jgi:hypothetical protein
LGAEIAEASEVVERIRFHVHTLSKRHEIAAGA